MKRLFLVFLILLISLSVGAVEKKYTLTWDANSEVDLAGYRVYMGTVTGTYTRVAEIGLVTTYSGAVQVPDDSLTNYYFVLTAFDTSNLESDYSNEVSATYDTRVSPAPPKNLKWYEKLLSWFKKLFNYV
jgi:hypothetical protein